ncbi:MAG TPA: MauE/DoxX family redox-associated membrane protein [Woeseiaceae bacterium]
MTVFELDPVYWHVCRWLVAGVFAVALAHKLHAPRAFAAIVREYAVVPDGAAPALAALVAAVEAGVIAGLTSSFAVRPGAALALFLLAAYAGGIALNLARGRRHIDCGCFGPAAAGRHALSGWLLLRNGVLGIPAALLLLPVAARALGWLELAGIAAATATALVTYAAADALAANAPRVVRIGR